jgi:hypothetical protein
MAKQGEPNDGAAKPKAKPRSRVAERATSRVVASGVSKSVHDDDGPSIEQLRRQRIALAAYYRAQSRGFEPGQEEADWHAAEAQIAAEDGNLQ